MGGGVTKLEVQGLKREVSGNLEKNGEGWGGPRWDLTGHEAAMGEGAGPDYDPTGEGPMIIDFS